MDLSGGVDSVDRHSIQGWVCATEDYLNPVALVAIVNGQRRIHLTAELYRTDLEQAGIGDGRHGFVVELGELSPFDAHEIVLQADHDGTPIPGSPFTIAPQTVWDERLEAALATALSQSKDAAALRRRAAFLAQQADRLLHRGREMTRSSPSRPEEHYSARWSGTASAPSGSDAEALVVASRLPQDGRDPDSTVLLSYLRSLGRLGFHRQIVAADLAGGIAAADLAAEGICCCHLPWSGSVEEVLRRDRGRFAAVMLHGAATQCYLPLVRQYQPQAQVVYSTSDSDIDRLEREAGGERSAVTREFLRMAAADRVIAHRRSDVLMRSAGLRVLTVPWSVRRQDDQLGFAMRTGIGFAADFTNPAALEGAWWLIREVMPILHASDPTLRCVLAGEGITDALRAAGSGVVLAASTSSTDLLAQIRVAVAPPPAGSGGAIWAAASLAAGLPCVCSTAAGAALGLTGSLQSLCADDTIRFAELCLRWHGDAEQNRTQGEVGQAFVLEEQSEMRSDKALAAALGAGSVH